MKTYLIISLLLFLSYPSPAFAADQYYPTQFIDDLKSGEISGSSLKKRLFAILSKPHQKNGTDNDSLGCETEGQSGCYRQVSHGYRTARKILFGTLHLESDDRGAYVKDVYCNRKIRPSETPIGRGEIPDSNIINCEHTWPQSRFNSSFPKSIQKTDLHHLFPTDSRANSVRGHSIFADVEDSGQPLNGCPNSLSESNGPRRFQPPHEHRGNVARALFYFSIRYDIEISSEEETILKVWNEEDPVDAVEIKRNNNIYLIQKNRNPFVDFPELANIISDF